MARKFTSIDPHWDRNISEVIIHFSVLWGCTKRSENDPIYGSTYGVLSTFHWFEKKEAKLWICIDFLKAHHVKIWIFQTRWVNNLDYFNESDKIQDNSVCFTGVTVYQASRVLNQSEVIIMFDTGVGVEVVENKGYMAARVYLPWTYIVSMRIFVYFWRDQSDNDGCRKNTVFFFFF